jgi:hypothetical protein
MTAFTEVAWAKALAAALGRWVFAPMLVAAALIGGYEAHLALESPGGVIRHDLIQAGTEVAQLRWSAPRERVRQSVSGHFPGYRASVDAAGFPVYVTVTLNDLDRDACRDAYRTARRIEGRVLIEIEGPGDVACQDGTALTWRIVP